MISWINALLKSWYIEPVDLVQRKKIKKVII